MGLRQCAYRHMGGKLGRGMGSLPEGGGVPGREHQGNYVEELPLINTHDYGGDIDTQGGNSS